jgi:hypothetical protein
MTDIKTENSERKEFKNTKNNSTFNDIADPDKVVLNFNTQTGINNKIHDTINSKTQIPQKNLV